MEVAEDDEGDNEDVEIVEIERPIISMQAALSHLDDLYLFSISQGDDVMSENVVESTKLVEDVKLKSKMQCKISDFFVKL